MRRLAAAIVCTALLLSLPQLSWQHVHTHGHDEHHAGGGAAFHVHQRTVPSGPAWRSHGPDEDARSLDGVRATPRGATSGVDVNLTASPALPVPTWRPATAPTTVAHGHDPPPDSSVGSRAPPA